MGQAAIRVKDGRARWCGLQTCGSVWHCPTCASKIAEGRREELVGTMDREIVAGAELWMCALTLPHTRFQKCKDLRDVLARSWSKLIAGAPWKRAAAKAGLRGWVRALEVTYGENGWHPHLHAVFVLRNGADASAEFGRWLFERWARIVERAGYGVCNPDIWRFERAAHRNAATDYVLKGNYDFELTRGHTKLARGGGRSPFQLLESSASGDRRAGALFQDFAATFKGARQVTYSKGLRDDARSDEAIAAEDCGEVIGFIPARIYARIAFRGLGAAVLDAAEDGGWGAVVFLLQGLGLWWNEPVPPFPCNFFSK